MVGGAAQPASLCSRNSALFPKALIISEKKLLVAEIGRPGTSHTLPPPPPLRVGTTRGWKLVGPAMLTTSRNKIAKKAADLWFRHQRVNSHETRNNTRSQGRDSLPLRPHFTSARSARKNKTRKKTAAKHATFTLPVTRGLRGNSVATGIKRGISLWQKQCIFSIPPR